MGTVVVGAVLVGVVCCVVRSLVKHHREGKSCGCGSSCGGCHGSCHSK